MRNLALTGLAPRGFKVKQLLELCRHLVSEVVADFWAELNLGAGNGCYRGSWYTAPVADRPLTVPTGRAGGFGPFQPKGVDMAISGTWQLALEQQL
tara:strand:- start:671 stop:958 length:288 start_codon:yes stop_codon:yes gene_type:complete